MSINIKEIFQSDNLSTSKDKINYNFDQILANGGGPQGLKGNKGTTGAIGSIGPKGNKGEAGGTGAKGNTGADGYWTLDSYTTPDQHTLLPKIQPTSGSTEGDKPTNLVLGRDDVQYVEDAIDRNALLSLTDENSGAYWTDIIRIRLKGGYGGAFNDTSAVVRLIPGTGGAKLKIATIGGNNSIELASNRIDLIGNDTSLVDGNGLTKLRITNYFNEAAGTWNFLTGSLIDIAANSTAITLKNNGNSSLLGNNIFGATGKTNTIAGTTTIAGAALKIQPTGNTLAANKILVSNDTNGTALWKSPYEVSGIYPIGTIVFVNPVDISTTYFSIADYVYPSGISPDTVSYQFFGRGKSGTRWAGWYLLMGQTNAWYSGNTLVSYVPTNIPGSILMGASAPDNSDLPGSVVLDGDFKSSMGTQGYNPPVGYGTSYQPTLRGDYTGVGSQGVIGPGSQTNVGDLLTQFGASASVYDVLNAGAQGVVLDGAGYSSGSGGYSVYPHPGFHPLPMAVYLGSNNLVYDYTEVVYEGE
jgi:hypothetical protein